MKNRGRMLAATAALLFMAASPQGQLETVLERNVISAGDTTFLRITFTRGENIQPLKVPAVPGLDIAYSGMQKSIEIINWKQTVNVVISFGITGERPGVYTVPRFMFQTSSGRVSSRPVTIRVVTGSAAPAGERGDGRIDARIALSKNTAYVGEPVVMDYYVLGSGVSVNFDGFQKNPSGDGFVFQQIDVAQKVDTVTEGGVNFTRYRVAAYALIPAAAGSFTVGGGLGVISTDMPDQTTFFGRPLPFNSQKGIGFDTRQVRVLPLPEGAPASFQGDVGSFSVKAEFEPGNVKVFQEKSVKVTVSGTGNFISMSRPRLEKAPSDLKVIIEDGEKSFRAEGAGIAGSKKFTFSLIPVKSGKIDAGGIALTFFNPATGRYETAKSGPIIFEAEGEAGEGRMSFDADRDNAPVDFNPLAIGALVLVVGALGTAFFLWERNRLRLLKREEVPAGRDAGEKQDDDRAVQTLRDFESAYRSDDRSRFLLHADRLLSLAGAKVSDSAVLDELKEKVYAYRYGGGSIDRAGMEELLKAVRGLSEKDG